MVKENGANGSKHSDVETLNYTLGSMFSPAGARNHHSCRKLFKKLCMEVRGNCPDHPRQDLVVAD